MLGFRIIIEDHTADLVTAIADAEARMLRVVGAETRRDAMNSIQPSEEPSKPGEPPRDITGRIKRFIRYAVDEDRSLVIIGPEYLPRKSQGVPKALERGGTSIDAQGDSVSIAARPFMSPALGRTLPRTLPRVLTDSVHS